MKQENPFSFDQLNILIFEEYVFVSEILSAMLKTFGLGQAHNVMDLLDARRILDNSTPTRLTTSIDFAIIDLPPPPNNHGFELLEWLRNHSNPSLQALPVIFTTSNSQEKVIFNSRDFGANEILVKPYSAHSVSQKLMNIINNPRSFIRCQQYTGPDRRRKRDTFDAQERRITKPEYKKPIGNKYAA